MPLSDRKNSTLVVPNSLAMMFTQLRSKFYYWHFFVALIILRYILLSVANFSQWRYLAQTTVPSDIQAHIDEASWSVIRTSGLKHFKFVFWKDFISQAYFLIMLGYGLLPKAWDAFTEYSKRSLHDYMDPTDDFTRSIVFNGLYSFVHIIILVPLLKIWKLQTDDIAELPFKLIGLLAFLALEWAFLIIVRAASKRKILATGILFSLLVIFMTLLAVAAPDILMMMHARLPQIPQTVGVYNLLRRVGFPIDRVLIDDVFNAFTAGLGQNAVILVGSRIMLAGVTGRALEASVAHELGHWTYYHYLINPIKISIIGGFGLFLFFYLVDRPSFYRSFGFHEYNKVPMSIGVLLFSILLAQMSCVSAPLLNFMNWQIEYQADAFSARLGYAKDLTASLTVFAKQHRLFEVPIMTTVYGLFNSTHPVFIDRVNAIAKYIT